MIRRIPLVATLVVLAAVAIMVRLGFWQLDRLHQKEALLARYAAAQALPGEIAWPGNAEAAEAMLYRRARLDCLEVTGATAMAGENAQGESGQARVAQCRLADGAQVRVIIGWARDMVVPDWRGGVVTGWIAPGPRLVADPPLAGLAADARPDPGDIPNNHLAYAVQWFLFAATALAIYAIALWKRLAVKAKHG